MSASLIPASTHLGYVHLTVSDLDRSIHWYQKSMGFKLHRQMGDTAYLGAGRNDLLVLTGNPHARRIERTTGLYHFAILTPSRLALAQTLQNFIDTGTRLTGWSDHLVSEAIYLDDPDGNGIEIYRDRPRDSWRYDGDKVRMAVDPLDAQGILNELGPEPPAWEGLHPDTVLGHMHLHVAWLDAALRFYRDVIGFELMALMNNSAAFVSAGGYHHHLGMNVWAGVGAPPPPADAIGLQYFTVMLPDRAALSDLTARLQASGCRYEELNQNLLVRDPSENRILFTVEAGA